jgi:hypothetical protein
VAVVPNQDRIQAAHGGYVRWKIRTRFSLAYHCRQLAQCEGLETADLLRVLICLSATPKFLGLPRNETFQKQVELRRMTGKRGYTPRVGGGHTTLLSVQLPQGLSRLITTYVNLTGQSRNHLIVGLLGMGLIMYLKAENALLETIGSLELDGDEREPRVTKID